MQRIWYIMRTIAREYVFKLIFASQFDNDIKDYNERISQMEGFSIEDKEYILDILQKIDEHREEIYKIIDMYSISFPQSRIFPADRSILLLSITEILYRDDIPDRVSINEAANIASKYSSEKSASFISGILSSIVAEK